MMADLGSSHETVLRNYPRAVVHMRKQHGNARFGLVFGAGLSKSVGLPTWSDLVTKIAKDPQVNGEGILKLAAPRASLPYKTEMLFEHFRSRQFAPVPPSERHSRELNFSIVTKWVDIVRKYLYASAPADFPSAVEGHAYLTKFLPLVTATHLTVTFNFDDFLEQAIELKRTPEEKQESRGFETVTNPWTQFRRQKAIIYHPNGVIPQRVLEAPSDRFVFSEASYAEQLIGISTGESASLIDHFTKNTCLLIGLSLEDQTLCNLLAQVARANPGNYHYFVSYVPSGTTPDTAHREAIRQTNFHVYNLITLFLEEKEIAALADLLLAKSHEFSDFARQKGVPTSFRFYVTGALGVGKSTTINYFRNLLVYDEWLEPKPEILAEPWDSLTDDQKTQADQWVARQFNLKNGKLRNDPMGITMLDRGPLDPLAFTKDAEWSKKAELLLGTIVPDKADWKVEPGRVIMLEGDPKELAVRLILTQREKYTSDKLQGMQELLRRAYAPAPSDAVVVVDTRGLLPPDVAKRVATIVHLEEYTDCNLHARLETLKTGGFNAV